MEIVKSALDLCVGLTAIFALALAYQAHEEREEVNERIDALSAKVDEIERGGQVRADRHERE